MDEIKLISAEWVPIERHRGYTKRINPLRHCCNTCKNFPECEKELRKIWTDNFDVMAENFECDFYRRKNSGAFRRKCRKFKHYIDRGTGMVTGATPEEMKGEK